MLVAHPSVSAKNVQELIAYAKSKPGVLNYGSSGNGTILHLGAAMFVGSGQARHSAHSLQGHGPADERRAGRPGAAGGGGGGPCGGAPHIKSGALRAMGVTTSTRVVSLPGVPTIAEQGLPAYELDGWIAPVAPAGLPKTELARLYNAFKAAMEMPEARDALVAQGYEIKLTARCRCRLLPQRSRAHGAGGEERQREAGLSGSRA